MIIKKKIQKPDVTEEKKVSGVQPAKADENKDIDIFDLDNIDFKQRHERRRGDRRRGFRRIDDRNLISRAREEAETIREAAAKEGYQDGIKQAKDDIELLRTSIKKYLSAKQEVFEYIAPDILEISVDIAQKIIKKEIRQNPETILESIMEILKTLPKEESKITIRTNPNQVNLLKQDVPAMIEDAGLEAKLMIVPDESVFEGGCMVTTTNGVIDATIETQLAVISEALKGL